MPGPTIATQSISINTLQYIIIIVQYTAIYSLRLLSHPASRLRVVLVHFLALNPPNQRHASHGRELVHDQTMGHLAMQYHYSSDKPCYHPAGISTMTVGCCSIVDCYWRNLLRQVQE
jgi:hypothetical protein